MIDDKFINFLDTLSPTGDPALIESIRSGYLAILEATLPTKQPWADEISSIKANSKEEWATKAYEVASKYVEGYQSVLERKLRELAPQAKIKISKKKLSSWLDKVVSRGKDARSIRDLLRAAVLVDDPTQAEAVTERIRKDFPVYQYDYKEQGSDPEWGYHGGHHIDVVLPGDLMAEVQVMPRRLWTYKRPAHNVYTDWRSVDREGEDWAKEQERSKQLFRYGNIPKYRSTDRELLNKSKMPSIEEI